MKKDLLTGHLLSEWATKRSRCAEYTCGEQWVDLGPVDVIVVRAEAVKQDFMATVSDFPPNDSVKSRIDTAASMASSVSIFTKTIRTYLTMF